jgi:hemoglobin-like flavoprotein
LNEYPSHEEAIMALTARQVELVQSTFKQVAPISDVAAELFYGRLFELDPSLRALFHNDMKTQGRALMGMLNVAVHGLNRLDTIAPAVEDLGHRHEGYGVATKDYQTVGEALLWTLEKGLGDSFTPEVKEAWAETYGILATTAIHGAEHHPVKTDAPELEPA